MREYFNPALRRWLTQRDDGTWTYRYRFIIEQEIGRRLERAEYVHHLNGDQTDDRPENLVVVTGKEHAAYHADGWAKWNRRDFKYEWSRDYPCCIDCDTTERKHAGHGLCAKCYFARRQRKLHAPRTPAVVVTKTCPWCGEEFTRRGAQKQTKYCSKFCAGSGEAQRVWATRRANGTDRGWKRPDVSERMRGTSPTKRAA